MATKQSVPALQLPALDATQPGAASDGPGSDASSAAGQGKSQTRDIDRKTHNPLASWRQTARFRFPCSDYGDSQKPWQLDVDMDNVIRGNKEFMNMDDNDRSSFGWCAGDKSIGPGFLDSEQRMAEKYYSDGRDTSYGRAMLVRIARHLVPQLCDGIAQLWYDADGVCTAVVKEPDTLQWTRLVNETKDAADADDGVLNNKTVEMAINRFASDMLQQVADTTLDNNDNGPATSVVSAATAVAIVFLALGETIYVPLSTRNNQYVSLGDLYSELYGRGTDATASLDYIVKNGGAPTTGHRGKMNQNVPVSGLMDKERFGLPLPYVTAGVFSDPRQDNPVSDVDTITRWLTLLFEKSLVESDGASFSPEANVPTTVVKSIESTRELRSEITSVEAAVSSQYYEQRSRNGKSTTFGVKKDNPTTKSYTMMDDQMALSMSNVIDRLASVAKDVPIVMGERTQVTHFMNSDSWMRSQYDAHIRDQINDLTTGRLQIPSRDPRVPLWSLSCARRQLNMRRIFFKEALARTGDPTIPVALSNVVYDHVSLTGIPKMEDSLSRLRKFSGGSFLRREPLFLGVKSGIDQYLPLGTEARSTIFAREYAISASDSVNRGRPAYSGLENERRELLNHRHGQNRHGIALFHGTVVAGQDLMMSAAPTESEYRIEGLSYSSRTVAPPLPIIMRSTTDVVNSLNSPTPPPKKVMSYPPITSVDDVKSIALYFEHLKDSNNNKSSWDTDDIVAQFRGTTRCFLWASQAALQCALLLCQQFCSALAATANITVPQTATAVAQDDSMVVNTVTVADAKKGNTLYNTAVHTLHYLGYEYATIATDYVRNSLVVPLLTGSCDDRVRYHGSLDRYDCGVFADWYVLTAAATVLSGIIPRLPADLEEVFLVMDVNATKDSHSLLKTLVAEIRKDDMALAPERHALAKILSVTLAASANKTKPINELYQAHAKIRGAMEQNQSAARSETFYNDLIQLQQKQADFVYSTFIGPALVVLFGAEGDRVYDTLNNPANPFRDDFLVTIVTKLASEEILDDALDDMHETHATFLKEQSSLATAIQLHKMHKVRTNPSTATSLALSGTNRYQRVRMQKQEARMIRKSTMKKLAKLKQHDFSSKASAFDVPIRHAIVGRESSAGKHIVPSLVLNQLASMLDQLWGGLFRRATGNTTDSIFYHVIDYACRAVTNAANPADKIQALYTKTFADIVNLQNQTQNPMDSMSAFMTGQLRDLCCGSYYARLLVAGDASGPTYKNPVDNAYCPLNPLVILPFLGPSVLLGACARWSQDFQARVWSYAGRPENRGSAFINKYQCNVPEDTVQYHIPGEVTTGQCATKLVELRNSIEEGIYSSVTISKEQRSIQDASRLDTLLIQDAHRMRTLDAFSLSVSGKVNTPNNAQTHDDDQVYTINPTVFGSLVRSVSFGLDRDASHNWDQHTTEAECSFDALTKGSISVPLRRRSLGDSFGPLFRKSSLPHSNAALGISGARAQTIDMFVGAQVFVPSGHTDAGIVFTARDVAHMVSSPYVASPTLLCQSQPDTPLDGTRRLLVQWTIPQASFRAEPVVVTTPKNIASFLLSGSGLMLAGSLEVVPVGAVRTTPKPLAYTNARCNSGDRMSPRGLVSPRRSSAAEITNFETAAIAKNRVMSPRSTVRPSIGSPRGTCIELMATVHVVCTVTVQVYDAPYGGFRNHGTLPVFERRTKICTTEDVARDLDSRIVVRVRVCA